MDVDLVFVRSKHNFNKWLRSEVNSL